MNSECDAMFLAGDFNARIGSLSDVLLGLDDVPKRTCIDQSINQHGHEFIDFLNESKFCVLNGRFSTLGDEFTSISRKGRSVVDYICVPQDVFGDCRSFEVLTVQAIVEENNLHGLLGDRSRLPDHSAIVMEFIPRISDTSEPADTKGCEWTRPRFNLNKIPVDFMESELVNRALIEIIEQIEGYRGTQGEIDNIYDNLCEAITSEMHRTIPKYGSSNSTSKRHRVRKPYWNETLGDLWNDLRLKENAFLRCKNNRSRKNALHREYILARDRFDKVLKRTERAYRRVVALDIETTSTSNPNDFWDKINKLGPRNKPSIPVEIVDDLGNCNRDENAVFERWRSDFEKLYNGGDSDEFDSEFYTSAKTHKSELENRLGEQTFDSEGLNRDISMVEVTRVVMKAKSRSSSGFDDIPYSVLKNPPIIAILRELFQLIFNTSVVPSIWRKSVICPILKDATSDRRVPMNYRGVSLLSCVSKLYSAFIDRRLQQYLNSNDILADEQNGFRADRSCQDHIFVLNSIIKNNPVVFTAFIDLRKCFDFIDRDMMLYKLLLNGISGKVYNAIKNIYQSSISCVKINNKVTEWFDCKTGVKQGDNMSPTIFSVFANDLVSDINDLDLGFEFDGRKLSALLYADDIAVCARSEEDLQCILDTLHNWCKRWRVLINTDKSKCMHFRKASAKQSEFVFTIGENMLETVDSYKYLGVIFHYKKDFNENAENLAKGAGRALGKIISKIHMLKDLGMKSYEKLYESCVVPILDYCSGVWGYRKYQSCDNVQNRAIRYFLGVHRFAPLLAINGDVGWLPSIYRRWLNIIRFWNRLNTLDNQRLTKLVFDKDYEKCRNNWCHELKDILSRLGLSDYYDNRAVINMALAESKMVDLYSKVWKESVCNVSKLRTYVQFKDNFKTEQYVNLNLQKNERSLLAQFRCGILPLRVETGRYIGEQVEDRLCRFCDLNTVEDETHFLINCPFYNEFRLTLLSGVVLTDLSDSRKLSYLLNEYPRKTAKFIVKAYIKRRNTIYN